MPGAPKFEIVDTHREAKQVYDDTSVYFGDTDLTHLFPELEGRKQVLIPSPEQQSSRPLSAEQLQVVIDDADRQLKSDPVPDEETRKQELKRARRTGLLIGLIPGALAVSVFAAVSFLPENDAPVVRESAILILSSLVLGGMFASHTQRDYVRSAQYRHSTLVQRHEELNELKIAAQQELGATANLE